MKKKVLKYTFLIFGCLFLQSCLNNKSIKKSRIYLFDSKKSRTEYAVLDTESCYKWGVKVLQNSLNDTAKIGIMCIPPNKEGILFRVECHTGIDSIPLSFDPYKATNGTLKIEYFQSNFF